LRFTTLSNGQYRTEFLGPFAVPAETGYFEASGGEWRTEKLAGGIDTGSYEFLDADTMLLRSAAGAVVWNRIKTDVGAAAAPSVAAGAPGTAPSAPGTTNAQPAGVDAIPAGPFGTPLPQTTGAGAFVPPQPSVLNPTQPFGAPGLPGSVQNGPLLPAAPFGVPKATPSSVFSATAAAPGSTGGATSAQGLPFNQPGAPAGFGGAPATFDSAASGVSRQLEANVQSLTDIPKQTLTDLERSTEQVAAEAINSATAPVTEAANDITRRAGERLQTFTGNATSKVRNFFTGRGRDKRDDDERAADDKDNR
jgi:hypothetical protein